MLFKSVASLESLLGVLGASSSGRGSESLTSLSELLFLLKNRFADRRAFSIASPPLVVEPGWIAEPAKASVDVLNHLSEER